MLEWLIERLEEHLLQHGVIVNIVLRTERSLFEEEGTREVTLYFAASDDQPDKPVVAIHLFPLDEEGMSEVEVEIEYTEHADQQGDGRRLWEQAKDIVANISWTQKQRYLAPGQLAESRVILDYHFLLDAPHTEAEEQQLKLTIERFAADLGQLVRL